MGFERLPLTGGVKENNQPHVPASGRRFAPCRPGRGDRNGLSLTPRLWLRFGGGSLG